MTEAKITLFFFWTVDESLMVLLCFCVHSLTTKFKWISGTKWQYKRWQYICDHKSRKSWWILITFTHLKIRMKTLCKQLNKLFVLIYFTCDVNITSQSRVIVTKMSKMSILKNTQKGLWFFTDLHQIWCAYRYWQYKGHSKWHTIKNIKN